MAINFFNPNTQTTPVLITDVSNVSGGSPDALQGLSTSAGEPISAALEIRSTGGALFIPRATNAQIDSMNLDNGSIVYNTTTGVFNAYANGVLSSFDALNVTSYGTISNAAIKALHNTPFLVVPAPGAGFGLICLGIYVQHVFATAAFTATPGSSLFLTYGIGAATGDSPEAAGGPAPFTTTSSSIVSLQIGFGADRVEPGMAITEFENKPLTLSSEPNQFTLGGGTGRYSLVYRIIPTG